MKTILSAFRSSSIRGYLRINGVVPLPPKLSLCRHLVSIPRRLRTYKTHGSEKTVSRVSPSPVIPKYLSSVRNFKLFPKLPSHQTSSSSLRRMSVYQSVFWKPSLSLEATTPSRCVQVSSELNLVNAKRSRAGADFSAWLTIEPRSSAINETSSLIMLQALMQWRCVYCSQGRTQGGGWGWKPPLSLIFYRNFIIRECIGLDFYKNKGSACRRICLLCQQTSLENMNMTSNCDVTKSVHQIQMTTICHWMNPPMKIFCVRHWLQRLDFTW